MAEVWRSIPGYEGRYEVSSLGRARSLPRRELGTHARTVPGCILKPMLNAEGYAYIGVRSNGKRRMLRLHRVVAEVFLPDKKNVLHREVAHLDGNRANPSLDNLKWVSKIENMSHKRMHGTHPAGERHPRAKLTAHQVARIRERYATSTEIARYYGISRHTVFDIWRGKRWAYADGEAGLIGEADDMRER